MAAPYGRRTESPKPMAREPTALPAFPPGSTRSLPTHAGKRTGGDGGCARSQSCARMATRASSIPGRGSSPARAHPAQRRAAGRSQSAVPPEPFYTVTATAILPNGKPFEGKGLEQDFFLSGRYLPRRYWTRRGATGLLRTVRQRRTPSRPPAGWELYASSHCDQQGTRNAIHHRSPGGLTSGIESFIRLYRVFRGRPHSRQSAHSAIATAGLADSPSRHSGPMPSRCRLARMQAGAAKAGHGDGHRARATRRWAPPTAATTHRRRCTDQTSSR